MVLIDSHSHLDFPQFDGDRRAVIDRARTAGLAAVVNVGTNVDTSRASLRLAEEHDLFRATVGIHPHHAENATPRALDRLRALAQHPAVVGVGEIGLDYYRDYAPRSVQRRAFRDQLALASELHLPVVIHSRDAHEDALRILEDWTGTGVLHTYSAGPRQLDQVIDMGFFIGISGPVTYAKARQLRGVARVAPLDRLLVETDCPYLTPEPHRGRRNEPSYVRFVAEAVAQLRGVSVQQIADATTSNARRLFGLPHQF